MLKLMFQYFGHLMGRADLSEKTLMLGKTEGRKRRGRQRMRWLDGIDSMDMSLRRPWETVKVGKPGMLQSMGSQSQTQLSNWTTTSFATYWMDLQMIILNEISQKETNTVWYQLLIYVESKIWYKWTYLWNRNRLTDVENTLVVVESQGVEKENISRLR